VLSRASGRRDYWDPAAGSLEDTSYWTEAKKRYFDSTLALLAKESAGRRLLDVGGGVAFFAERALQRGWDAYSLDSSDTVTRLAGERVGEKRAWISFDEDASHSFDVVTLWCVVAHTTEPGELLLLARKALRPGGQIWVSTPNFRFQKPYSSARALLRRPLDFAAHDHIVHFTPESLRLLLVRAGFKDTTFRFEGITEACLVAGSRAPLLVAGKRVWNTIAFAAARLGLPNLTSELQVTAVSCDARGSARPTRDRIAGA